MRVARAGVVVLAAEGPGKAACTHAAAAAGRVRGRTYLHAKCMVEAQKSVEGQTDDPEAAGRARDGRSRPAGQWSGFGEPRSTRRAAICAHTVRFSAIHSPPRRVRTLTAHVPRTCQTMLPARAGPRAALCLVGMRVTSTGPP